MHETRHAMEHGTEHPRPAMPTAALVEEHALILRALTVAERLEAATAAGRPLDRGTLVFLVDFFRTFADQCHHAKEEQHLFPALVRRGVPVEGGPIGVMLAEHDEGRRLLGRVAEGDDREAASAIRAYASLLRGHIDKENHVLFPLADTVLGPDEHLAVARGFEAVEATWPSGTHARLMADLERVEARTAGPAPTA